ncbi:MAG: PTS-dependent dihydroxyacetone kinase phosphotransferase subunit DhaM [Ruminococcus sp.]|nr:PTS-dependent dihydroxyacetone kinase phosphotransferase subunit DhaM [Candidatus Copronaster equi]
MVGIVIISHSKKLAEGVLDATKIMADGCPVAIAGGADDGGYGTSYEKINNAVNEVYSEDGVIVLVDMGSAVMTAEMVLEDLGYDNVLMVDCPIAEGAIAASVSSLCGDNLETVKEQALSTKTEAKW